MKLLLTILLFTTLNANAQEAFVMGKSYPLGWVVWYPSYGTFYKSKSTKSFTARTTPDKDPLRWDSYTYPLPDLPKPKPVDPAVVTPAYVRQSAFDSLLVRVQQLENRPQTGINRTAIDSINNRLLPLEKGTGAITFRVSKTGTPIVRKVNDSTYEFPGIELGTGLTATPTDNVTKIDIKKTAAPTAVKATVKKTVKK